MSSKLTALKERMSSLSMPSLPSFKVPQLRRAQPHASWQHAGVEKRKKIVVLGSGWGGYSFINNIDRKFYEIQLVSPRNHFLFTPLLASTCVGTLEFRCITEPIRHISNVGYHQSRCMCVDSDAQVLTLRDSFDIDNFYELHYDYLIYACGAKSATFGIPGVVEHAFFLKQVIHAMAIRDKIQQLFESASKPNFTRAQREKMLSIVIVGGGPTSIEFAGELHDWLMEDAAKMFPKLIDHVTISLLEASGNILSGFGADLADYTLKTFRKRRIKVMTNSAVAALDSDFVHLNDGHQIPYGMCVWATGMMPAKLTESIQWPKSKAGRILVNDFLQVPSIEQCNVYAIGDAAESMRGALPPTAQVAAQGGKYIAKKFNHCLQSPVEEFDRVHAAYDKSFDYMHKGTMAYIGGWRGVVGLPGHLEASNQAMKRVTRLSGLRAWLFWRSVYFTKLRSGPNQILVPMFWFKAWLFGRDFTRF